MKILKNVKVKSNKVEGENITTPSVPDGTYDVVVWSNNEVSAYEVGYVDELKISEIKTETQNQKTKNK